MAGPIVRTGRYFAAGVPDLAIVNANLQRAYSADNPGGSGNVWWYRIGARVGSSGGSKRFRLAMMDTTTGSGSRGAGSRVPSAVLKYTAEATTSSVFSGSNEGETRFVNLTEPYLGALNKGYAFAAASRDNGFIIGMTQAANIPTAHNTWFYDRATDGSGIPQAGYSTTVNAGHEAIWAEGELNVAPNDPGVVVKSGAVNSQTPTLTASFSDANETLENGVAWDRLEAHYHEIWWGGVKQWDATYTADAGERSARQSSRTIGISVPFDTVITYYVRHQDRGGLWSRNREYTFTVQSGASVDAPLTPAGRVTNLTDPGNVTAVYRHNGGLSTNGVQAQLQSSSGAPIATSAVKATTVAPNGTISMTWAETGFGAQPAGAERRIAVAARDTNNNWSQFSVGTTITMNAAPSTPIWDSPAAGAVSSIRPLLVFYASDDVGTPTVYARVKNNAGTVLFTRTMTHVGSGRYEYQTTATDMASYATYKFDAYSYDTFLYSGAATSAGAAALSPERSYVYAAVPAVTITAPAGPNVTTAQPTFTWTSSGQVAYRVQALNAASTVVYDTGVISGGAQTHAVVPGYWQGGEVWNNTEQFTWTVAVQAGSTLWGQSADKPLTLAYTPPTILAITGTAASLPDMEGTHYAHLTTSTTTYGAGVFLYYEWTRSDVTGFNGAIITGTTATLSRQTDAATTSLYDFDMTPGQWYRYTVRQFVQQGVDVIQSLPVTVDVMVDFHGTLFHMPYDPMNTAVWLQYGPLGGEYAPSVSSEYETEPVRPISGSLPYDYSSRDRSRDASAEYGIVPSDAMTAEARLAALWRLYDYQNAALSPDGRPHIICRREGRGGVSSRMYGRITSMEQTHAQGWTYDVALDFAERHYAPGVE